MKHKFIIRQLQLVSSKTYTTSDSRCIYENLRDYLVLPSKIKLQYIVSGTDISKVLLKTYPKLDNDRQKLCILIVHEMNRRPTVAYSGGILSGMANNDPESKPQRCWGIY